MTDTSLQSQFFAYLIANWQQFAQDMTICRKWTFTQTAAKSGIKVLVLSKASGQAASASGSISSKTMPLSGSQRMLLVTPRWLTFVQPRPGLLRNEPAPTSRTKSPATSPTISLNTS